MQLTPSALKIQIQEIQTMFGKESRERDIVNGIRRGENAAMRDFYALYSGRLSAVCLRYVGNHDDVQDVMQDVMLTVISHIDSFSYRGEGSLQAWAMRIVITSSLSFLRSRSRLCAVSLDTETERLADTCDETPEVADIPSCELQTMISQLPDGYRTVFNLYVIEGKSHKEIASLLGIRESSSASQLHRAKAILARRVKEYVRGCNL